MEKVPKIDYSKVKPSDIKISYNGSLTLDYDWLENVLTDSEKRTLDALKIKIRTTVGRLMYVRNVPKNI